MYPRTRRPPRREVEPWQWIAGGLAIDGAAYARELVDAMLADGLTVIDAPGGPSDPRVQ